MGIWKGKMSIYFCEMEETENSNFCLMQDQGVRWHQLLHSNSTKKKRWWCWCPTPSPWLYPAILKQYLTPVRLTKPDSKPHPKASIVAQPCPVPWSCLMPLGLPPPASAPVSLPGQGEPTDHSNFLIRGPRWSGWDSDTLEMSQLILSLGILNKFLQHLTQI